MSSPDESAGAAHTTPRLALLACKVFEKEIALYAQGAGHLVETRFFEIGLHDCPDQLRATLQAEIDSLNERTDFDAIVLAYGLCGRGTAGLHSRHRLAIPRAHDCITVFMGSKEAYAEHQRRCPTCYYYTPGWNRARRVAGPDMFEAMRQDLSQRFDPEDVEYLVETQREQLEMHDTGSYLDLGTSDAQSEETYARDCATWMGWKFEHLPSSPQLFKDLLWGRWDNERFLILEPGNRLGQSADELIMRAEAPAPDPGKHE